MRLFKEKNIIKCLLYPYIFNYIISYIYIYIYIWIWRENADRYLFFNMRSKEAMENKATVIAIASKAFQKDSTNLEHEIKYWNHYDHSIIKIGEHIDTSPEDLRRLALTHTSEKMYIYELLLKNPGQKTRHHNNQQKTKSAKLSTLLSRRTTE